MDKLHTYWQGNTLMRGSQFGLCVCIYQIFLSQTHLLWMLGQKQGAQSGSWQLKMLIPVHERGLTIHGGPASVCLQRGNLEQASWLCAGRTSPALSWLLGHTAIAPGPCLVWIAGLMTDVCMDYGHKKRPATVRTLMFCDSDLRLDWEVCFKIIHIKLFIFIKVSKYPACWKAFNWVKFLSQHWFCSKALSTNLQTIVSACPPGCCELYQPFYTSQSHHSRWKLL